MFRYSPTTHPLPNSLPRRDPALAAFYRWYKEQLEAQRQQRRLERLLNRWREEQKALAAKLLA